VRGLEIGPDRWAKLMRGLRLLETRRARELRRLSPAAERMVWPRLKNRALHGAKFIRSAKLIVEIDGATHSTDEEIAHDQRRTAFLETEGYRVVRFSNQQIFENVEAVIDEIARALAEVARGAADRGHPPAPHLTSPREARGERGRERLREPSSVAPGETRRGDPASTQVAARPLSPPSAGRGRVRGAGDWPQSCAQTAMPKRQPPYSVLSEKRNIC